MYSLPMKDVQYVKWYFGVRYMSSAKQQCTYGVELEVIANELESWTQTWNGHYTVYVNSHLVMELLVTN